MNSSNKNTKENFSLPALQNGDRAEFARVVNAYSDQIYRLALKMLRDPQDAEDILQETFINAYHGFSGFKGNSKISTWLYSIATNEALMLIRRRKENEISLQKTVESDEGDSFEPLNLTDWCCLPESELLSTEAIDYLDRAIEIISENLRAVFLLRDIEGLSTAETADVLGISEGAVKTRLSRARLKLRELLSGYYGNKLTGSPIHSQTGEKEGR